MDIRQVKKEDVLRIVEFVEEAAHHFEAHPDHTTYTRGDIEPGCLFALRWGMFEDCVVVFKLAEDFEPLNFTQAIPRKPGDHL